MKVQLANKILSGFSAVLSLIVLITCIWILSCLLIQKNKSGQPDCQRGSWKDGNGSPCYNNTDLTFDDEHAHSSDFHDTVVIENAELTPRSFETWIKFYDMDYTFHSIIIACLSCAIVASLTQFVCSVAIMCCPSYRMAARSRRVVVILFVAFVVFLMCFSWPLAYKRDYSDKDDTMHTISTLNTSANDFIMNFEAHQLFEDFTLYYIEIFANIIFLFFYMVITCCLLRCNDNQQYDT